jgi:hypothetical protein
VRQAALAALAGHSSPEKYIGNLAAFALRFRCTSRRRITMSLIRGVLLAGRFLTQHQLDALSDDDQRNTLIFELGNHTTDSIGHLQSLQDDILAGIGAVFVFLRDTGIRTEAQLKTINDDAMRNILIVELGIQTGLSGPILQGMSNLDLVALGLGKDGSFIRGMLLAGQFRSQHQLNGLSHDAQRNILIVEMSGRTNQPVPHFQAMSDADLAGAAAVLLFLRNGGIRTDAQLKTISDDDQRNIAIVEVGAQTKLGSQLQGLSSMDVVLLALGVNASPPKAGLGSNSNYILSSQCNPMLDLSVIIEVTKDIVWEASSGSDSGFGFQLNAYSPKNELSAWQQYVVVLLGKKLFGWVNNWPVKGPNIINSMVLLTELDRVALPAGYTIMISLHNDNLGNITGARYRVIDQFDQIKADTTQTLLSIGSVTPEDLAPITAFELNLVGPENGESATLLSGAGKIVYEASTAMTVLQKEPDCTESGYVTAEMANSFYDPLPAVPGTTFRQSFNVIARAQPIRKRGKPRPRLTVPKDYVTVG